MNTKLKKSFLLLGLLWAAVASTAMAAPTDANKSRPNLLVIHCDQLSFRMLGCYRDLLPKEQAFPWGEEVALATPHIDAIAKRGAVCDKFYAASPVCTPSRASFVSGRYPQNTGSITNNLPLDDSVVTFAEVLRRHGYATGYAGKWHLDGVAKPGWAPRRQFGFADNRYMFNRGHWKNLEDSPDGPKVVGGENAKAAKAADEKSFATDFLADRTVEFIRKHKAEPFCYMVSFPDPHGPRTVRPPYDTQFSNLKIGVPRNATLPATDMPYWGTTQAGKFGSAAEYLGMTKCIDDNVGKILAELEANDLLDRTIVIFTADHGDMCGEHGRNSKDLPHEASAKIPFVICAPGRIKPGTVVSSALDTTDFKPTILSLMGFPADARDEGRDFSSLLLSGETPDGWKDIAFSRIGNEKAGWIGAFTPRYKLVISPVGEPCLLDLKTDPDELTNVFLKAEYRQTVRELARALQEHGRKFKEPLMENAAVRADLEWAASEGDAPYVPLERPKPGL